MEFGWKSNDQKAKNVLTASFENFQGGTPGSERELSRRGRVGFNQRPQH